MKTTLANQTKLARLEEALGALLDEVLRRDFHGTACIELIITEGTIQRFCRKVERIER